MEKIRPEELSLNFSTEFFFDTNIWIILFGNLGNYNRSSQNEYSKFFENVLSKNCSIYLTSMILSEYANVILRIEFANWQKQQGKLNLKYKQDFVGTDVYKEKVQLVKNQIAKILNLKNIIKLPDDFNALNLDSIFVNFGPVDFNDAYINEIVKLKKCILVTEDEDFKEIYSEKTLVTLS